MLLPVWAWAPTTELATATGRETRGTVVRAASLEVEVKELQLRTMQRKVWLVNKWALLHITLPATILSIITLPLSPISLPAITLPAITLSSTTLSAIIIVLPVAPTRSPVPARALPAVLACFATLVITRVAGQKGSVRPQNHL